MTKIKDKESTEGSQREAKNYIQEKPVRLLADFSG